jgi:CheY-specific phosphatase CheX
MIFYQYFGNYLLEKGYIRPGQLKDVLDEQRSVHVKLSVLALINRMLSAAQVEEITALQKFSGRKFGDIAVERGDLTREQVDRLLTMRQLEHYQLSQGLINRKYLSFSALEQALGRYRVDSGLSDREFEALRSKDIAYDPGKLLKMDSWIDGPSSRRRASRWELTRRAILEDTNNDLIRRCILIFAKCLTRFVNANIRIESARAAGREAHINDYLISQRMYGDIDLYTALCGEEKSLLALASGFGGEPVSRLDELSISCVSEFLNSANGMCVSSFYDSGFLVNLAPQQAARVEKVSFDNEPLMTSFILEKGELRLYIASGCPNIVIPNINRG